MTIMDRNGTLTDVYGDTFYLAFADITENDVAFSFTSCTASFTIKAHSTDTTNLVSITETTGITLNSSLTTITVTAATMAANCPKGSYVWSFVLTRADGRKETWFHNEKLVIK